MPESRIYIYKRGLLRCRPDDQGNARSLKQQDGNMYRFLRYSYFLTNQTRQGGEDCGTLYHHMKIPIDTPGIDWYDVRKKYRHNRRISESQVTSIAQNFNLRLFSQDRESVSYCFPIKLIRSIFANAARIRSNSKVKYLNPKLLDKAGDLKVKLEDAIDSCIDRIQFYVAEPYNEGTNIANSTYDIPKGMWAYPFASVKKLGFKKDSGEIFIQLYRSEDNIRQVYTLNPDTDVWEPVRGVTKLSQLHLDHRPSMKEILLHSMPDLSAIKKITDIDLQPSYLKATDSPDYIQLWKTLLPMLEELLRDVIAILAQYHLVLTHESHNKP